MSAPVCARRLPLLLAVLLAWFPLRADIVLTEFMADNGSTLRDEDGDSADWIEIANTGNAAESLAGYALSADPTWTLRWAFPARILQPGEFLTVFASSKNRTDPARPLHTDFNLPKEGGSLALLRPDGSAAQEFAYPALPRDVSYGRGMALAATPLTPVVAGASCRWRCPTASSPQTGWQEPAFADTSWNLATTGVGYDTVTTDTNFATLLGGSGSNTQTAMRNTNTVCYLRVPFMVANPRQVARLTFRLKYDDGFALWLNGVKVASDNAPDHPAYDSSALASRPNAMAVVYQEFDLTPHLGLLRSGSNLLALQGLNYDFGSVDFLLVPELRLDLVDFASPATAGFLSPPTPGYANGTAFAGLVQPVAASVPRGFVSDTSVTVALSCPTEGAQIRYTTTGAAPTATTGAVYTAPLTFTANTILRAAAFRAGDKPSATATFSYLFPASTIAQGAAPTLGGSGFPSTWGNEFSDTTGEPLSTTVPADYQMDPTVTTASAYQSLMVPALTTTLPVLSLAFDRAEMFGVNGIYANRREASGEGAEVPVSVEYFNPAAPDEQFALDAGVRMHGGNARDHPKKPLRLHFRSKYGASKLNYPLFPGSPVESFDSLVLRGGGHDSWAVPFGGFSYDLGLHGTYLRDQFLRRTELEAGLLSPRGRYVHLFLCGLYWGVYDLHERAGDAFFADHLGGSKDDYDVVKHKEFSSDLYGLASGSAASWDATLALASGGKLSDALNYHFFRELVDVQNLSDHLIVRMWAGDYDWMAPVYRGSSEVGYFSGKNWYAGRRTRGDRGLFRFFCWDAEMSMGSHLLANRLGGVPAQRVTDMDLTQINGDYDGPDNLPDGLPDGNPAQLYEQLRASAEFRRTFGDRVHRLLVQPGGKLTAASAQARLDDMRATLNLPIVAESARWGDVNDADTGGVAFTRDVHWSSEVTWLRNTFIQNRANTVAGQFRARGLLSSVSAPGFATAAGRVPAGTLLTLTGPAGATLRYTTDGSDPWLGETVSPVPLVTGSTPALWLNPKDGSLGDTWRTLAGPASLAGWSAGENGFGSPDASGLFAEFLDTPAETSAAAPSLYVRHTFTLATQEEIGALSRLFLRVRYDDGIAAYLNGTEVARLNAPASPSWNSAASSDRPDKAVSTLPENVDLTSRLGLLRVGANVLAIQLLTRPAGTPGQLLDARLEGYRVTPAGPNPAALDYSAPLTLQRTQTVRARAFVSSTNFSALAEARYLVGEPATAANLVVSELSYRPAAPRTAAEAAVADERSDFEYVELRNISAGPVDLSDARFSAGVECVLDGEGTLLPAGASALVVNNRAAFTARHGAAAAARIVGVFTPGLALSNTGETLTLLAADGSVIRSFAYSNLPPWPAAADGLGFSLELINPASNPDHGNPASWRASLDPGGTPGTDPAGNTFAAWRGAVFNPDAPDFETQAAAGADPDGDGRPNLLEFALGLDPLRRETAAPLAFATVSNSGVVYPALTVRCRPGGAGLSITAEATDDFGDWTASGVVLENTTPNTDGTETRTYRSTTAIQDSTRRFLRLRVTSDNP